MVQEQTYEIGMVGLGTMGRNLALNMADHGFAVAGYDRDPGKVQALNTEAGAAKARGTATLKEMISLLRVPRAVMMLVPAGPPVDAVIRDLLPHLQPGDVIIDGGNSHFPDTELRMKALEAKGIRYLGVGISGGEAGARHGPSLMPGGPPEAYERVRSILEAIAAKVNGEPCVAYIGPGGAGHYVKMVHNGIEYGLMQLIAETYDMMKRGLGLTDDELHAIYDRWNQSELNGYLIEITANIFEECDEKTGRHLIDVILDAAKQLGTGKWTSQEAMEVQVPIPTIDAAVAMRELSGREAERTAVHKALGQAIPTFDGERAAFIERLRRSLYASMILTYAQGMDLLRAASTTHQYSLNLQEIARIWRGGCIIRSALVEEIRAAYERQPALITLIVDPDLSGKLQERQRDLRYGVQTAAELGIPVAAMAASLAYFDSYRSDWLPANLIQAQRDYFGAHSYERVDAKGKFHTRWEEE